MLEAIHYIFLGLLGSITILWTLVSMGYVEPRNDELYTRKEGYIESAIHSIENTFEYLADLPPHHRPKVYEHLDEGRLHNAHDAARSHHDVFHFFKNF